MGWSQAAATAAVFGWYSRHDPWHLVGLVLSILLASCGFSLASAFLAALSARSVGGLVFIFSLFDGMCLVLYWPPLLLAVSSSN